jgi:hypothetical protein
MVNRQFRTAYNRKRIRRVMQLHGTLMHRALWARFGEATLTSSHAGQWLSDNGHQYTAPLGALRSRANSVSRPFHQAGWIYEGEGRWLAPARLQHGDQVRFGRSGRDHSKWFPSLAAEIAG